MPQNSFFRSVAPAALLTLGAVGLVRAFDPGASALLEGTASAATKASTGGTTAAAPKSGSTAGGSTSSGSGSSGSSSSASCSTATETTGPVVQTRWGPVQVAATIAGGQVCSAHAVVYPDGDQHSADISAQVIPALDQRASSQGVSFDAISGATYTSEGDRQSLQGLLDSLK
jgi:hypothetical protein